MNDKGEKGKALINEAYGILKTYNFQIAGELTPKNAITAIKETNPHGEVRSISFIYEQTRTTLLLTQQSRWHRMFLQKSMISLQSKEVFLYETRTTMTRNIRLRQV